MSDIECEGWTNWETWLINVHFGDAISEIVENEQRNMTNDEIQALVEETVFEVPQYQDRQPFNDLVAVVFKDFLHNVDWDALENHYSVRA